MIGDKPRKTRRVSKKVKKIHEEVVAKGVLGATAPTEPKKGGGPWDIYKIDVKKDDTVVESKVIDDWGVNHNMSLGNLFNMIDSHPGSKVHIEKSDRFSGKTIKYVFKKKD
jgi:hypothetical protein